MLHHDSTDSLKTFVVYVADVTWIFKDFSICWSRHRFLNASDAINRYHFDACPVLEFIRHAARDSWNPHSMISSGSASKRSERGSGTTVALPPVVALLRRDGHRCRSILYFFRACVTNWPHASYQSHGRARPRPHSSRREIPCVPLV